MKAMYFVPYVREAQSEGRWRDVFPYTTVQTGQQI